MIFGTSLVVRGCMFVCMAQRCMICYAFYFRNARHQVVWPWFRHIFDPRYLLSGYDELELQARTRTLISVLVTKI